MTARITRTGLGVGQKLDLAAALVYMFAETKQAPTAFRTTPTGFEYCLPTPREHSRPVPMSYEVVEAQPSDPVVGRLGNLVRFLLFDTANATPNSLNQLPSDASLHYLLLNQQRGAVILAAGLHDVLTDDDTRALMKLPEDKFLRLMERVLDGQVNPYQFQVLSVG